MRMCGYVCLHGHGRVALLIQHAKRVRHIVCGRSGSTTFFDVNKRRDFRKKVSEYKMRVLIFYTILFDTFLFLRRIQQGIVINVKTRSCKVPIILIGF
jgi:hypothetical protein